MADTTSSWVIGEKSLGGRAGGSSGKLIGTSEGCSLKNLALKAWALDGSSEERPWFVRIAGMKETRRLWRHLATLQRSSSLVFEMMVLAQSRLALQVAFFRALWAACQSWSLAVRRSAARVPHSWFHQGTGWEEKGLHLSKVSSDAMSISRWRSSVLESMSSLVLRGGSGQVGRCCFHASSLSGAMRKPKEGGGPVGGISLGGKYFTRSAAWSEPREASLSTAKSWKRLS